MNDTHLGSVKKFGYFKFVPATEGSNISPALSETCKQSERCYEYLNILNNSNLCQQRELTFLQQLARHVINLEGVTSIEYPSQHSRGEI